eukprot:scaffold8938_cov213-Skeletonema_marinoi.AAC.5
MASAALGIKYDNQQSQPIIIIQSFTSVFSEAFLRREAPFIVSGSYLLVVKCLDGFSCNQPIIYGAVGLQVSSAQRSWSG